MTEQMHVLGTFNFELADTIADDHEGGAHEPPPCRFSAQRVAPCAGTLRRVDYRDGETRFMCTAHEERARARGFLSRAHVTNWLPPLACPACTHAPVTVR